MMKDFIYAAEIKNALTVAEIGKYWMMNWRI